MQADHHILSFRILWRKTSPFYQIRSWDNFRERGQKYLQPGNILPSIIMRWSPWNLLKTTSFNNCWTILLHFWNNWSKLIFGKIFKYSKGGAKNSRWKGKGPVSFPLRLRLGVNWLFSFKTLLSVVVYHQSAVVLIVLQWILSYWATENK